MEHKLRSELIVTQYYLIYYAGGEVAQQNQRKRPWNVLGISEEKLKQQSDVRGKY